MEIIVQGNGTTLSMKGVEQITIKGHGSQPSLVLHDETKSAGRAKAADKAKTADKAETADPPLQDAVNQFFKEHEQKFAWDLLPFRFLFDLFRAWAAQDASFAYAKGIGKFEFIKYISSASAESKIWSCGGTTKTIKPSKRMDAEEPLVEQYGLKQWTDPKRCSKYNGLLRVTA